MATLTKYSGTITGDYRAPLTDATDLDGQKEVSVTYVVSNFNADTAGNLKIELFHAPRNNVADYSTSAVTDSGDISASGVHNSYITAFSRFLTLKAHWSGTITENTTADVEVLLVPKS